MVLVRGGIAVKPHVQRFADAIVAEFGISLSPGTYNGHSPPEGPTQALDLFTPNNPQGWAFQERICNWIIQNAKRFGVRYTIRWNPNGSDWIWNIERAAEGWRAMATRDHPDHVHVTFYASAPATTPDKPTPPKEIADVFLFSTAPKVQGGSFWFVTAGIAYRMHVPADVERLINKGVPNLGEMSEAFLNVFDKRG